MAPPFSHKTESRYGDSSIPETSLIVSSITYPTYYFRFMVSNNGRSQARNCEAIIEEILFKNNQGEYIPLENFSPLNLTWALFGGQFININPGRIIYCDILHITKYISKEIDFIFDFIHHPRSHPTSFKIAHFNITISICSENAKKIEKKFMIEWSGNWKDTEEEMFKEITIMAL